MSERTEQVNHLLKKEIGGYLQEHLVGHAGFLTLTAVETTPDLKLATIWYSYVGDDLGTVMKSLKKERRRIQAFINKRLMMKSVPRLVFQYDNSGEYAASISKVIEKAQETDETNRDSESTK